MKSHGSTAWPVARRRAIAAMLLMLGGAGEPTLLGQSVAPGDGPGVAVGGDVARPFTLTLGDLKSMPRTSVTVTEGGRASTYDGVLIAEVLKRAGAPLGSELSGRALRAMCS